MGCKSNCVENAAIEGLFSTLKAGYFHLVAPSSLDAFEAGVHGCIRYYSHEGIKLRLNGLSPMGYRLRNAT